MPAFHLPDRTAYLFAVTFYCVVRDPADLPPVLMTFYNSYYLFLL